MEVFAPDPVDEMAARVRARWSAADRRRANVAWWCADTATVPRTPPTVLMDALAGEFDAYAAHRRTVDCAVALPDPACKQGGATLQIPTDSAAATRPSSGPMARPRVDHARLWVALAIGAVAVLLVLLLVGLALGPLWRARNQPDATQDDDDDPGNNEGGVDDATPGVLPAATIKSA
ncbi:hypothetical protein pqer_cds_280 [Pandoravirus quercus]|uniref:Uncharacterized protein n=2 Tax=Pandoravirus TaxID=2060084 RepID=A0A2U7U8I8_9VIRU|nr:hypothetical protein pqer_cds_280 [Pandoravirus quercus]AVK74702.1 hypothetical protein pqer_cds_280 [Pandoravirus quercus]QBZ80879.1 hypothetical protein pclt_cds_281 [Pandoravirus celtis]